MRKLLFCECPVSHYRDRKAVCGKPAFYKWTPRRNPNNARFMCKEHGELTAGNFTDELRELGSSHVMTQKEFAAMGGRARAKKLTKKRQSEIARKAGLASAKRRSNFGQKKNKNSS